jgi:hypothetical protein
MASTSDIDLEKHVGSARNKRRPIFISSHDHVLIPRDAHPHRRVDATEEETPGIIGLGLRDQVGVCTPDLKPR